MNFDKKGREVRAFDNNSLMNNCGRISILKEFTTFRLDAFFLFPTFTVNTIQ